MPPFVKGDLKFVEMLKQHTPFTSNWADDAAADETSVDVRGKLFIKMDFPDPEKLLDTATADFNRFLEESGTSGNSMPVNIIHITGLALEEYTLDITDQAITISASDTEAIRRAVYFLMDMIAGSPVLTKKHFSRKPWLKNRVSRCFFGPIKRPPFNVDELMNDIDYYPEEYLSRLAHDGVNGLWLTIVFREICDTSIRKAHPDAAKRIAKLRHTVERCRRYGIKIWVFAIEPINWSVLRGNPLPPGAEELLGPGYTAAQCGEDLNSFCPKSELAGKYLYECTNSLFKAVPHLGGLMTISYGERMTSCISMMNPTAPGVLPCPDCELSISQIMAKVLAPMRQGMKDANPDADMISWFYVPYVNQTNDWITQLPLELPSDISIAFNFESGMNRYQLGKVRTGGDYWLSGEGPAERFSLMAKAAAGHCRMAAKLQVACSHECATIPYIPAPGLVYRKYAKMKELGVSNVIQCWYFGNYPGLMNEAAGKLAYEDFSGGEEAFLEALAKPVWGRDSHLAVKAWQAFADGYSNYPMDITFQYYGPMHDGPVWPLHLKQQMRSLTRSWKPDEFPAGDMMGECYEHFDLHEVCELANIMSAKWAEGLKFLQQSSARGTELELTLAEALNIQFASGHNILRFYALRNKLMDAPRDAAILLAAMKEIVRDEIENSVRLAALCRMDARLGYHSEAEVYKYFPEKLFWRADTLKKLLDTDFAEAEKLVSDPAHLASFIEKRESSALPGKTYGANGIFWSFEYGIDEVKFHVRLEHPEECDEHINILIADRKGVMPAKHTEFVTKTSVDAENDCWYADFTVSRAGFNFDDVFYVGFERICYHADETKYTNDVPGEFSHDYRLKFGCLHGEKLRRVELC